MLEIITCSLAVAAMLLLWSTRTAHASGVGHPVYPVEASPEQVERLKVAVTPVMTMSEDEMVALIPDKTGFRFMGCPNCAEGTQEGQLTWIVSDPHHVTCRYCGMVYPNENYPEDKALTVVNPVGKTVEYPYWEDKTGYRYLFSARAWREARGYFSARSEDLGNLYQMTGDRAYARRAALILDAFARYYPGFLVSSDRAYEQKGFVLQPPYPNNGGKWGRWRHDEMPIDLIYAYDSIFNSGELERLSEESGADVRARIKNDLFLGAIRQDSHHGIIYSNASPRIYWGYATIGRVIGEPSLVHEAVRRSLGLFEQRFTVDGFWCEGSVGYHRMTMIGMQRVLDALRGYADPPGYSDPQDGTRFNDLDLERDIPIIARAKRILEICRYPDARSITVHDNWGRIDIPEPPERSVSTLLAGAGHAWLGMGEGEDQVQLHLHFSGGYGHEHADNLNLILFARGLELLPDLGYTHTRYRAWSRSTLCHNTVLIDGQRQYTQGGRGPSDGRLLAFETTCEPVQWAEANAEAAYPGLASVYRRMLMLVDAGDGAAYAVDLFRIKGGSRHDWALHGNADLDGRGTVSVPLTPYGEHLLPNVNVRYPAHERDKGTAEGDNPNYAFFQNVSHGKAADGVTVTFEVPERSAGVRTHLPGLSGADIFLGNAPSFRRAEENDALLDRYRMPIFLARRDGPPPLSSCFAAVHEPYSERPFLEDVSIRTQQDQDGMIYLQVRHHGVVDHIVHQGQKDHHGVWIDGLYLQGEMGFVRERDGIPEAMGLWGGIEIRWGDYVLSGSGTFSGQVTGVRRKADGASCDALVVLGPLPDGDLRKGTVVRVTLGDGTTMAHRILRIETAGKERLVVLESDPGLSVSEKTARRRFFPLREVPGRVAYLIRTSAFVSRLNASVQLESTGKAVFAKP